MPKKVKIQSGEMTAFRFLYGVTYRIDNDDVRNSFEVDLLLEYIYAEQSVEIP